MLDAFVDAVQPFELPEVWALIELQRFTGIRPGEVSIMRSCDVDTSGPVWQGRFRAFPIAHDEHFLRALRYVEGNALRAALVNRAEHWPWGSLNWRHQSTLPVRLADPPVALPSNWMNYVNEVPSAQELTAIRRCLNKQHPYGNVLDVVHGREPVPHVAASQQISSS